MIILDTNVISAMMQPDLNPLPIAWMNKLSRNDLWTTSVNVLESRSGLLLLPSGRRRTQLLKNLDLVLGHILSGRVLPFDRDAAECSARISSMRIPAGRNIGTRDTQIAGIATARNATLATRNVKDFQDLTIPVINPWDA